MTSRASDTRIARRVLARWMIFVQCAGLVILLIFTGAALLAILPLYMRDSRGKPVLTVIPSDQPPLVSWVVGIGFLLAGLFCWVAVAVGLARRMNDIVEWILNRFGTGVGMTERDADRDESLLRALKKLELWRRTIDARVSDVQVRGAVLSGRMLIHEFRKLFTLVSLRAKPMKRVPGCPEEFARTFDQAVDETRAYLGELEHLIHGELNKMNRIDMQEIVERAHSHLLRGRRRVRVEAPRGDAEDRPFIHGMPALLRAVVKNLIHNALEATEGFGGEVWVSVRVAARRVIVRVEDGAELGEEKAETLFLLPPEPPPRRGRGHYGLGLPLCRAFILLHGGRLTFEPAAYAGENKAFQIDLPLATTGEDLEIETEVGR